MLSHKGFSIWYLIVALLLIVLGMIMQGFEVVKFGNVALSYAFALTVDAGWHYWYINRNLNNDEAILSDPVALAIRGGSVVVGGALGSSIL